MRSLARAGARAGIVVCLFLTFVLVAAIASPSVRANPGLVEGPTVISTASPYAPGCNGAPQTGVAYPGTAVEPSVAVDPTNPKRVVGAYQQDRWSNGGANGLVSAVSLDQGGSWRLSAAAFSHCTGGTASNGGDYERASDPWVSIGPDGTAYEISISFDSSTATNAVTVSRSTDGGLTWSNPTLLASSPSPARFNDKETVTADPHHPGVVYATWDLAFYALGNYRDAFEQPAYFSRSADGGKTWTKARVIYDPGVQNGTVANQILVLPDGTLLDLFSLFRYNYVRFQFYQWIAVMRSADQGTTWSAPILVSTQFPFGVFDPLTGGLLRTGSLVPDAAVDPVTGTVYVVWEDGIVSAPSYGEHIAMSVSRDGGLRWTSPFVVDHSPVDVFAPAFTPTVEVAPDGTVAVTYYNVSASWLRNGFPADRSQMPVEYWMVLCHPSTANCLDPSRWSEIPLSPAFNILAAPYAYGYFVGDYEGLAATGNDAFVAFFARTTGTPSAPTAVFAAFVSGF